jgi:ABC-2 type transport system ATP-binding protein
VLEIAGRGGSVLLSSHVLSEVEAVCQRVAILREGELVALAPIEELRARVVRHLTVRFRREPPPGLRHVEGVTAFRLDGNEAVLWVRGDVNPLLRVLAAAEVEHLVFPEPLLEDIFLGYYRAEGAGR